MSQLKYSAFEKGQHEQEKADDEENGDDQQRDLYKAVGAVALHFARAAIDDYLVDLLVQPVSPRIDRQQQMLEGDPGVVRRHIRNALLVPSDGAAHIAFDDARRKHLGLLEPFAQLDLIALRFVAGQISGLIRFYLDQIPGLKSVETIGGQRARGRNEQIVEPARDIAGGPVPARL